MGSKFNNDNSYCGPWTFNEYSHFFAYHTIFFRPKLRLEFDINEPTTFTPHLGNGNTEYRFLKLRIRNTGHRPLHNCMAQIHILIPRNNIDRMDFPSDEYKQLAWDRSTNLSNLSEATDIQGHNFSLVHVVFSERRFVGRYACVSTFRDLRSGNHRTEDTFVNRHYVAKILITTDEGPHVKTFFDIEVNQNWELLTMHRMSWIRTKIWKLMNGYYF
jgi:hypothetical protein